jgi:Pyridoxamine 5'-phosphate oxidase
MTGKEPKVTDTYYPHSGSPTAWSEAFELLAAADTYWLSTVRPDGRPHTVPLLATSVDDTLYFAAGASTRKVANLTNDPHCVVTTNSGGVDFVVEGSVIQVRDDAKLQEVADAYVSKYRWQITLTVEDGALPEIFGGAPTSGPPPYYVYEVIPSVSFGFPNEAAFDPTRWAF